MQNAPLIATGCLNPGQAFHPKYYEFRGAGETSIAVGSANLSERALTSNHEVLSVHEGSLKLRSAVQPLVGRADEILQRVPREVAILVVDRPDPGSVHGQSFAAMAGVY